jgi:hypothetical protein
MDNAIQPTELQILYGIYFASVVVHIISLAVHLTWVIPLQIREAGVKNGLRKLRVLMLSSGLAFIVMDVISIIVLTLRFFIPEGPLLRYLIVGLIFMHSFSFLVFSFIKRTMYRQQYSEHQKNLHAKIEKLEEGKKIS